MGSMILDFLAHLYLVGAVVVFVTLAIAGWVKYRRDYGTDRWEYGNHPLSAIMSRVIIATFIWPVVFISVICKLIIIHFIIK